MNSLMVGLGGFIGANLRYWNNYSCERGIAYYTFH